MASTKSRDTAIVTVSTRSTRSSNATSRRALGDVSNTNSGTGDQEKATAASSSAQTDPADGDAAAPRRSRRLSREAAVAPETSNTIAVASAAVKEDRPRKTGTKRRNVQRKQRHPFAEPQPKTLKAAAGAKKKARTAANPRKRKSKEFMPPVHVPKRRKGDTTHCQFILTNNFHGIQRPNFRSHQFIAGIAPHDVHHVDDAQQSAGYLTDLFQRIFQSESETQPLPYLDRQESLTPIMRAILVDWIVEVHMKFRLLPETLYLTINIIDRYLSKVDIDRKRLQLVGVTALLMACKYEEIFPPEVRDCVYITDRAYTRQDVLDMEANICLVLKFSFSVSTGHPFLQRFLQLLGVDQVPTLLANYYMERMLQEHDVLRFRPSQLATAAVALALNNPSYVEDDPEAGYQGIPPLLLEYSGYDETQIFAAALLIEKTLGKQQDESHFNRTLDSVQKKFLKDRRLAVSDERNYVLPSVGHMLCDEDDSY